MKFATRLYIGFGLIIIVMTTLLAINLNISSVQNEEFNEIVKDRYGKIRLLSNMRLETYYTWVALSGDSTPIDLESKTIPQRLSEINGNYNSLVERSKSEAERSDLLELSLYVTEYETLVEKITFQQDMNMPVTEDDQIKLEELRDLIIDTVSGLIQRQEQVMNEMLGHNEERFQLAIIVGIGSIGFGIILGIVLSFWSVRKITLRLHKVKEVMSNMVNGSDQYPRLPISNDDEIGEIAKAYNEMVASLEVHEQKERKYKVKIEQQNWLKTSLSELSVLTQDLHDLQNLSVNYLQELVPIVDGNYGVMYLKEGGGEQAYLRKLATYANHTAKARIQIGEDLAGQCLQDGKPIILNEVPEHYIKVSSGLGEASPRSIIILPIHMNGEVIAVIELGSIHEFTEISRDLLLRATGQLGLVINRIQKQMQVKQLLEETQALNDELQSQSEELQLQQEELRTMNEELEAQYKQSEQRSNDLEEAKKALEEKTKQVLLSSQYKTEFLANMSHELRTPLNSLLILAQILVENKDGNLTKKQTEYANTIYTAGKDLLDLINEILDLSKIESGKVEYKVSSIDVRGITAFIKNQFNVIAEQKGIKFKVTVDDEIPAILYSDEQKVYQVLKNLVSNAMKFTEKGSVTVNIAKAKSDDNHDDNYIAFIVKDTGIGISEDKQELIFEAFTQADGTTSRKFGGTGLGLSISKGMADLLGGYITVDSTPGQGSTFTFYLPTQMESKPETQRNEEVAATVEELEDYNAPKMNGNELKEPMWVQYQKNQKEELLTGKNILLVDDDMRNVFALTTALENVGMNVLFAENGKEALDILDDKNDIDLVLMDIMMPEMDGYEAMRKIRASNRFERLPIIALTAKAMKDDRQKCIDAGASDYISKPVNLEQLLSLLKVWLYK